MSKSSRFVALDSFRGLAATMVATYHFSVTSHLWGLRLVQHAYMFVDFFFVLSGFVIAHAYGDRIVKGADFGAFIVRRFGRLWPLAATMTVVFFVTEVAKLILSHAGISAGTPAFQPGGYTTLDSLPGHFLLTTSLGFNNQLTWNAPDWSISAEFWTYIVFGLAVLLVPRGRAIIFVLIAAAAAALLAAKSEHGIDTTYDYGFVRCLYGFMVGQLVYIAYRKTDAQALPDTPWLEAATLALVAVFVVMATRHSGSLLAPLVFAAPVYVFAFERGALSRLATRPWPARLGELSYSIYMVHSFIFFVLSMGISVLARKLGWGDPWIINHYDGVWGRLLVANPWLLDAFYAAYLAMVLTMAMLTKAYIEDPGRRFFGRIADGIGQQPSRLSPQTTPRR